LLPQSTAEVRKGELGIDGGIHSQCHDIFKDGVVLVAGIFQRVTGTIEQCLTCRYAEIGHNPLWRLIFLWIIPNGVWIVVPGILIKFFGKEIIQRLDSGGRKRE